MKTARTPHPAAGRRWDATNEETGAHLVRVGDRGRSA
jgi:hypothetical protein